MEIIRRNTCPWVLELGGIDPTSEAGGMEIRAALLKTPLVLIRNQVVSKEQFHKLMNKVGRSVEQKFTKSHVVDIFEKSRSQLNSISELGWHADQSYQTEYPEILCLYAVSAPQEEGRTHWANTKLALESLQPEITARIANLQALHEFERFDYYLSELMDFGSQHFKKVSYAFDKGTQPVIKDWRGQMHLCLNHGFTSEILNAPAELLPSLLDHIVSPEHVYSHQWSPGDLIFANNHLLIHKRDKFSDSRRHLYRGLIYLPPYSS